MGNESKEIQEKMPVQRKVSSNFLLTTHPTKATSD